MQDGRWGGSYKGHNSILWGGAHTHVLKVGDGAPGLQIYRITGLQILRGGRGIAAFRGFPHCPSEKEGIGGTFWLET